MDLETIRQEARAVAEELITTAQMKPGQILVVGCSSSEIHNSKLGTDSSQEIGQAVFEALYACTKEHGLYLAAQCCEHLNRAVVLERAAAEKYGYEPVCAVPWLHGGGSFAMAAYYGLEDAVTVERVQAHAGIDIGDVLIGMQLKAVAVPVRVSQKRSEMRTLSARGQDRIHRRRADALRGRSGDEKVRNCVFVNTKMPYRRKVKFPTLYAFLMVGFTFYFAFLASRFRRKKIFCFR